MPVEVGPAEWRRLTGDRDAPRPPCGGCGRAKGACECLELRLLSQIRSRGLLEPRRQVRPIPGRRFAFDFGWPDRRLLVEVQGGTALGRRGGHTSPAGMRRDAEKLNLAVLAGYRVVVVTSDMVRDGTALAFIEQALAMGQKP